MKSLDVFLTSDGELTKRYYAHLSAMGPSGLIAMNLFRAQKCSTRAKLYHRRAHREDAYARKTWSIDQLCEVLMLHAIKFNIRFGWKEDPNVLFDNDKPSWVFYIDLPKFGQVSYHCKDRGKKGPDYPGEWDGEKGQSQTRVLNFCNFVFENFEQTTP